MFRVDDICVVDDEEGKKLGGDIDMNYFKSLLSIKQFQLFFLFQKC